ncbi:MAG: hypothetical protein ACRDL9_13320 [Trebonia sp.]
MLRLHGTEVRPAHRGEFRVLVAARSAGLGQLRSYLTADLLRRYAERTGLTPAVIDLHPRREAELRAACDRLNIHPPGHTLTRPFHAEQLAGQFPDGIREPVFDVGVRAAGETAAARVQPLAGHWIQVAGAAGGPATDGERVELGAEPLIVRMRLMRQGYGAELTADLSPRAGGDGELARWRELVAGWARSPSGAMSRPYADAIAAAFADGLNTPAALGELAALTDDTSVPDGVKFETFAAADGLVGLDLARDVGR